MKSEPTGLVDAFDYRNSEELYVALGCGDVSVSRIINKLGDLSKEKQDPLLVPNAPNETKTGDTSVTVLGLKGMLTTFARCCKPVPGDDIVGYITRGRGVTIHRQDCPNILRMDDHERNIKVSWGTASTTYPVPILIKAYDRQGLMGDISNVLNEENINILDVNFKGQPSSSLAQPDS